MTQETDSIVVPAQHNSSAEAWLQIGWSTQSNGFDFLTRIGERYHDHQDRETGTEYFYLPDYYEHPTIKDDEGYPVTLSLSSRMWAQRFLDRMTEGRPCGGFTIVGEEREAGWIVSWDFDRRRG